MTPKEKAEGLVDKYKDLVIGFYLKDKLESSKQCAIIAVDEIINELEGSNSTKEGGFFWQEVKEEIEKL